MSDTGSWEAVVSVPGDDLERSDEFVLEPVVRALAWGEPAYSCSCSHFLAKLVSFPEQVLMAWSLSTLTREDGSLGK